MSRRVILNAMIEAYPEHLIRPGDEVWCVNGAFRHQKKLTRVYFFDELKYFPEGFADELNLLPSGVRVISTKSHPEIMRSEPYPILEMIRYFNGIRNWVCTASYMVTQAIYERFDTIVLSGMYSERDSLEYLLHARCMDFWLGVAMGNGMKIDVHGGTSLCKPFSWEPPLYGYQTNGTREPIHHAMSAAYLFAATFPCNPITHVDVDALPKDHP